ncbi:MAG: ribosome biosis GTPase Der [Francisellaceae bacterium]|nr:ribosome biosis GTPase Der [Francisellaceae bacterium]
MKSIPVIAIVGRPNVGKSTLFNQLTRSRDALVVDLPGVTRDRHYGEGRLGDIPFLVIDTGGIGTIEKEVEALMSEQSWQAINEADIIFFMCDARVGLLDSDRQIANRLRKHSKKSIYLIVNKTDGLDQDQALIDFYALGFAKVVAIAASHGRGVTQLIEEVLAPYETEFLTPENAAIDNRIKVAIVGRPNVGKSTLVNRLLGEERVIVFDEPGTTRDSIYIPFERNGELFTLIDTAGVRRRAKVNETVEKFSVIKTLQAIKETQVVILVIDATLGLLDQDLNLLGFIIESGKALVIAINKWDGLPLESKTDIKKAIDFRLNFVDFAKMHFISALHGTNVGHLFESVLRAYRSATKDLSTSVLTRLLELAVKKHPPHLHQGRRIKLRYAHNGGHNPPIIVIHGNQTEAVTESYKRYLINFFRVQLKLEGTPLRIEFKTSVNPFEGRRNILTPRQLLKRKRLIDHFKKKHRK